MPDKIFLHLLIICVIWSQEIIRTVANDEIRKSSENLVRQKRVINRIQGEDEPVPINRVPYIVRIKRYTRVNCVGSILSHNVAITSVSCIQLEVPQYYVLSGAARLDVGPNHTVIDIKRRFGNHPNRPADGIALLTVDPPFVFGPYCNPIELHSGTLLPGTAGTISGWGYNPRSANPGTCHPRYLRSIQLPIMAHRNCVNIYRHLNIQISDVDICTFHPQKQCGHIDGGAPLVVDGYLAGLLLWTGPDRSEDHPEYPDVFAVLQHSVYNQWIRSHI